MNDTIKTENGDLIKINTITEVYKIKDVIYIKSDRVIYKLITIDLDNVEVCDEIVKLLNKNIREVTNEHHL